MITVNVFQLIAWLLAVVLAWTGEISWWIPVIVFLAISKLNVEIGRN